MTETFHPHIGLDREYWGGKAAGQAGIREGDIATSFLRRYNRMFG